MLELPNANTGRSIKYLGHWISPKPGGKAWQKHSDSRRDKALAAYHILNRRGLRQGDDTVHAGLLLYETIIDPILFYGDANWSPNEAQLQELDRRQARILKKQMGLHHLAPTNWVLWETATLPARERLSLAKLQQVGNHIRTRHREYQSQLKSCKQKKRKKILKQQADKRPTPTLETGRAAQILTRWGYDIQDADDMIRPPPSRAFPAKKEWSNLCQNLAATAHSKTFAEWKCKQADTIYSTVSL
jgi:hypothetical protein